VPRANVEEKLPSLGSGFRRNDARDAIFVVCLITKTKNKTRLPWGNKLPASRGGAGGLSWRKTHLAFDPGYEDAQAFLVAAERGLPCAGAQRPPGPLRRRSQGSPPLLLWPNSLPPPPAAATKSSVSGARQARKKCNWPRTLSWTGRLLSQPVLSIAEGTGGMDETSRIRIQQKAQARWPMNLFGNFRLRSVVGEALEPGNEGGRDGHLTMPNLTLDLALVTSVGPNDVHRPELQTFADPRSCVNDYLNQESIPFPLLATGAGLLNQGHYIRNSPMGHRPTGLVPSCKLRNIG